MKLHTESLARSVFIRLDESKLGDGDKFEQVVIENDMTELRKVERAWKRFSDNYFDMAPFSEVVLTYPKSGLTKEEFESNI